MDDDRTSGLGAFGFHLGDDRRYLGGSLGLSIVVLLDLEDALPVPFGQLRVGQLELAWAEVTVGASDPLFFTNLIGAGLGVRTASDVHLRVGLTLYGKVLRDALEVPDEKDEGPLVLGADNDNNAGLYIDLRVLGSESGLGLDLGALLAPQPSVRLGLSYGFDGP